MKQLTPLATQAAFSLVEIAVAISIFSLGVLSTVALLPTGLESLKASADETAQARITQTVSARVQGSDWNRTNNLADFQGRLFHFDRMGNETPEADVFAAQLEVATTGSSLPAVCDKGLTQNLRTIKVKITLMPDTVPDRFNNPKKFKQVSILTAKMGR